MRESRANVFGIGCLTAVAKPIVIDDHSLIDTWAGEPQAQRPRHRGFGPSGIRRTMSACIAPHGRDRATGRKPG